MNYDKRIFKIEAVSNSHNFCDYMKKNNNRTKKLTVIKNNVSFINILKEKISNVNNK